MNYSDKTQGFTLIELMLVISIIGILAAVAIPAYTDYLRRAKVAESLQLITGIKKNIADYYAWHGEIPADNQALNLPAPAQLRGNYTKSIEIKQGSLHIQYFDADRLGHATEEAVLSLRLSLPKQQLTAQTLIWVCGYAQPLPDFAMVDENRTNLNPAYLPDTCQANSIKGL